MKRLLGLMLIGLVALQACEILDAPYKKDNIVITSDRKVLLEDYTGHRCPNCPTAASIVHQIKETYGENVVVIAVHSGSLAKLLIPPTIYDFTTGPGDIWCDYFGVEAVGFPSGLINRLERSGSRVIGPNNWATVAGEILAKSAEAEIVLDASYNETSREITVVANTNISSPVQGEKYYLTIVLTEDSIIQPQLNSNTTIGAIPVILDYVHNHVLRISLTDPWGLQINPAVIDEKQVVHLLDAASDIIPEHCHLVAFISNSKKEVIQAEEVKLIP